MAEGRAVDVDVEEEAELGEPLRSCDTGTGTMAKRLPAFFARLEFPGIPIPLQSRIQLS